MIDIQVFHDKEAWIDGITSDFIQAMAGIPVSRPLRLCLAGGQTPEPVYREFSRLMMEGKSGLRSVLLVPGDERVSIGNPAELNETMLGRAFNPAIASGAARLFSWFDEKYERLAGDNEPAPSGSHEPSSSPGYDAGKDFVTNFSSKLTDDLARTMIQTMEARLALLAPSGHVLFDLCYLGLGSDGHTAGLFPGMPGLDDPGLCIRGLAPLPPRQRVSLGFSALISTERTRYILSATGKEAALERLRSGDPDCPATRAATADTIAFVLA